MPPVSGPQGSRGGLITAVAVFTILFVVATIFAIYYGVAASKVTDEFEKYRTSSEAVTHNPASPEVADLRGDQYFTGLTNAALDVSIARTAKLVSVITGQALPLDTPAGDAPKQACISAASAVAVAKTTVGDSASFPTDGSNLIGVINALSSAVVDLKNQNAALTTQRDQAMTDAKAQIAADQAQIDARAKDVDAANAASQKALDDETAALKAKDDQIAQMMQDMGGERTADAGNVNRVQVALAAAEQQLADAKKLITSLTAKIEGIRTPVENGVIDRPGGAIVSVPNDQVCYINLGQGDQISPGMTFEVYDKSQPLPKLGDGTSDENMPIGKGSIEVTQVGATTSQCRIVKLEPGMNFVEGDLILNLVYDRNTKYNFVVYGEFDLANSGKASPQDTDVIKRLITQWGGKLQDKIDADTDFVVLGKEPDVPVFSKEELDDPFNAKTLADAQAAANAYDSVKQQAKDLHIPVMNQNRFLYFVGYYDLATR
jgi:hypothetical protein